MNDKIVIELYPYNVNLTIDRFTDIIVLYKDASYAITNFEDEMAEGRLDDIFYYGYLHVSDRVIERLKLLKENEINDNEELIWASELESNEK